MSEASPPSYDRRRFLVRSAQALVAAGVVVAAEACGDAAALASAPRRARTNNLATAQWRRLAGSLRGRLVLPENRAYARDRLLFNSKFADPRPAAIAYCANADDVARCVDFVTRHDLDVAARSGGHSYGGYSSSRGLVIDVSPMNAVVVDTRANTALVGSGARLIDVYDEVGRHDRLLPGGSCPTVGVAGLTLGGGVGVFGRRYGLTCDNLRSATIVTAGGDHLAVDSSRHADLLWACRGGGGGNFGIVTSLTFDVHSQPPVSLFTLQYPWTAAATVVEAWQHWIASASDDLWSSCQLLAQGSYGLLVQVSGVDCGTSAALSDHLAALRASIGGSPTSSFVAGDDYLEAMKVEAGCSKLTLASCHLDTASPPGVLSHEAYSAKSSYLDAPTTSARAAAFVQALEDLHHEAPTLGGSLAFDAYGGAINRVPAQDTAFVHRDKLAGVQATYSWSGYTPAAEITTGQRWLTWLGSHVFDAAAGAYQNYIDPTLVGWARAYYGQNLERLVGVKGRYDPDNLFSFAQSIPVRP